MSLLDRIAADRVSAAKAGVAWERDLLSTLYAEASMVGKNARNDKSTDEEVTTVTLKFKKGAEETIAALTRTGASEETVERSAREVRVLERYLPSQMSEEELRDAVRAAVGSTGASSPGDMGRVMAELKKRHAGQYDGKLASTMVKEALS